MKKARGRTGLRTKALRRGAYVGRSRTPGAGPVRASATASTAGHQVLDDGVLWRSGVVAVVVAIAGGRVMHRVDHHRVVVRLAASGQRENLAFVLGQVIRCTILELELKRRSGGRESDMPSHIVYILGEAGRQYMSEASGENLVRMSRIRERDEGLPLWVKVLKLVLAQLTADVNLITALGTVNVDGPKVIVWFVALTVKSVDSTVP